MSSVQAKPGIFAAPFYVDEMLGPILLTIHNLTYYQRLVANARKAIEEDRFAEFKREYEENLS